MVIRRIGRRSEEYPTRLEHLHDPPDDLWARGALALPADRMVAIVGTRRATEYGRRMAADIAWGVASAGWTVVSGLASGIDAAAHRGALDAAGATVAVLGCGVDRVFPRGNAGLYESVARYGLLLSEFEPGTGPRKHHFPQRNRIIAALSRAVVVVQAGQPSGALITADLASEIGRDVMAVPGPVDQAVSRGVNRLLREGAGVATSAADVLETLGDPPPASSALHQPSLFDGEEEPGSPRAGSPESRLRAALCTGPAPLHDVSARTGLAVPATLAALGRLEVRGVVRSLPGCRFELVRYS
jgi:DNA processing protein